MGLTVRVREATVDDVEAVLGFHRALYMEYREALVSDDEYELSAYRDLGSVLLEDARALLRDRRACVLLAEREGSLVGYITGRVVEQPRRLLSRRGVVEDWFVVSKARRAGVGRRLLEEILAWFVTRGCQVAESVTLSRNDGARRVHHALGFNEVEVRYRRRLARAEPVEVGSALRPASKRRD